eukprot:1480193-Amphidinium_carterae.1
MLQNHVLIRDELCVCCSGILLQESHGSGRLASAVAVSAAALVALQHSDRNASCYYDIRADGSVDRMSPWKRLWEAVDSRGTLLKGQASA